MAMRMLKTTEYLDLHGLFAGIVAEQLGGELPLPMEVEVLVQGGAASSQTVSEKALRWLELLDLCVTPALFRTRVQKQMPDEETLVSVVRYLAGKSVHMEADRDRLDWLLTYLFKRRSNAGSMIGFGAVRESITSWLRDVARRQLSEPAQNLLSEVAAAVEDVTDIRSFEQLTESGLIHRGRELKQNFKEEFFHPEVLPAIVNYNLVFGRRFDQLFAQAAKQARDFASEIADKDYRSTGEDFRKLSSAVREEKRKPSVVQPAPAPAAAAQPIQAAEPPLPEDPMARMKALGIDPSRQEAQLKTTIADIGGFVKSAGRAVKNIPLPHDTLPVSEWESVAFAVDYPPNDHTFRAEFGRLMRAAIGHIARMHEELASYHEKRGTEYLWKPHYDALIYLLYFGQQHILRLEEFAADTRSRGLFEKADQIAKTTEKLREYLERVAQVF